ncbi:MAG: phosphatidylinositol-specific phospholipase C1-like protein [Pseudoxanthomonas sp.]
MQATLLLLSAAVSAAASACDLHAADAAAAGQACEQRWMDANLRLDEIQLLATHNSYKQPLPAAAMARHRAADTDGADGIDYAHLPLPQQLDRGVRGLELDVYYDPQGGRYPHADLAPEQAAAMRGPGFKVMHLSDIDYRSNCQPFVACLRELYDWSRAHPRHILVVVQINAKDEPAAPGAVQPLPFDTPAFDALDAEIRSVFPEDKLITPDEVQGDHPSLRDAVLARRWPTLGEARGRFLFALDEGPAKVALYRGARPSLQGRAMFVNADEDSPAAAWLTLNDPLADADRIRDALAQGFFVRTRADADTREARRNDVRRRDAAFAGGAQVVSTDYIDANPRFGPYRVALPGGGIARCVPVRAAACAGKTIGESP